MTRTRLTAGPKVLAARSAARRREKETRHADDQMPDVAVTVFHNRFPSWSLDTLLTHPRCALHLCQEVARRLKVRCTADFEHDVLRSLMRGRKRGDLKRDPD